MFNIADFLKKFSKIEESSFLQKEAISSILKNTCGFDIPFDVKKGIIFIKSSPVAKAAVFTKKQTILGLLKEKHPQLKISDIR